MVKFMMLNRKYTERSMTRIGKQEERRARCPRKRKPLFAPKTGAKKDNLPSGYKEHTNSVEGLENIFISKIK